jgi:hypothetical protein
MASGAFLTSALKVMELNKEKTDMGVHYTRGLKPFKSFLPERYRDARQKRALGKALSEEVLEQSDEIVDVRLQMLWDKVRCLERRLWLVWV